MKKLLGDIEGDKRFAIAETSAVTMTFLYPDYDRIFSSKPLVCLSLSFLFFIFLFFKPATVFLGRNFAIVSPPIAWSARGNQVNRWNKIHTFIPKSNFKFKMSKSAARVYRETRADTRATSSMNAGNSFKINFHRRETAGAARYHPCSRAFEKKWIFEIWEREREKKRRSEDER